MKLKQLYKLGLASGLLAIGLIEGLNLANAKQKQIDSADRPILPHVANLIARAKQPLKDDLSEMLRGVMDSNLRPPRDVLSTTPSWQAVVGSQVEASRGKQYRVCLFGDSISSPLQNSLGSQTFNFAVGGMSTVSLLKQLQQLALEKVKCQAAIVEIGTNDAWYTIDDEQFSHNLAQIIDQLRSQGTRKIVLLPAFYSTFAASQDPTLAGPLERVDEINQLMGRVAATKRVPVQRNAIQPLFTGGTLKSDLTLDGVHLNAQGLQIYRTALLKIIARL